MKKRSKRRTKRNALARLENRAANGRSRPGHSIGKAHRLKPGMCPNPGGRPKIKVVSEAARALLASAVPQPDYGRSNSLLGAPPFSRASESPSVS